MNIFIFLHFICCLLLFLQKAAEAREECSNGEFCDPGYYCSKIHRGYCIPNGKTECPHFNGSCDNNHYCGKTRCIPIGHSECADGNYCDPGHFCGKILRGKCISNGNTECGHLNHSCKPGYYCGKKHCVPNGHNECPNGQYCEDAGYVCNERNRCFLNGFIQCQHFNGSCDGQHFCGKKHCIPIANDATECPNGLFCKAGLYCGKLHTNSCFLVGKTECEHFEGSCDNKHYCGKKQCIPKGLDECLSGNYCDPGYYCSQFRPGKCYPNGYTECQLFEGSCDNKHFCGKKHCIPIANDATECPNGLFCKSGNYCGKLHTNSCFPIGDVECEHFNDSCDKKHFCGKNQCIPVGHYECSNFNGSCNSQHFCGRNQCIPIGHTECSHFHGSCNDQHYCGKKQCIPIEHDECLNGRYCDRGYYCSTYRTGNCIPNGHVECTNFNGSCNSQHYCGKKACVPIGRIECSDGRTCDQNNYCAERSEACIPRGHAECPGVNALGYCRAGMQCQKGICVPEGRELCKDGVHHCDQQTQVCDPTFSIIHPTNATRGCLYKDVAKCEEYIELENTLRCGPGGYLMGFAFNYCRRFYAHFYVLDTKEQNTLGCITECLLQSVRRYLGHQTNVDCVELSSAAKTSERQCYQKCELCALSIPYAHPFWSIIKDGRISMDERKIIAQMCDDLGYANHVINNNLEEEENE